MDGNHVFPLLTYICHKMFLFASAKKKEIAFKDFGFNTSFSC